MSFEGFLRACAEDGQIEETHVICASENRILAAHARPPYRMDTLRLLFSMTKSVVSLAVGIARDMGLVDLDERICDIFRAETPKHPHENLSRITVRHLLTMSAGMHENTYDRLYPQPDWVRAYLAQDFPHAPGTFYRYSTHGSHMLSAIITKRTGLMLEDFLNARLFHPMGIFEAQWEHSPEGLTAGGMGLSLYPASLVKLAQMILSGGVYQGRRLISEEYIALATRVQMIKKDDAGAYRGNGYGFQFHIGRDGCFRMDGAFGQLCLMDPVRKLIVVVLSCRAKMERLLELVHAHLLEAEPDWTADGLTGMDAPPPDKGRKCRLTGEYELESSEAGMERISLVQEPGGGYRMKLWSGDRACAICFWPGRSVNGRARWLKDIEVHEQEYVCRADADEECLNLTVYWIETPCVCAFRLGASDQGIWFEMNVQGCIQGSGFSAAGRRIGGSA